MSISIQPKQRIILAKESVQPAGAQQFYIGVGWAMNPGKEADLDLYALLLKDGKPFDDNSLIYYANLNVPGITHSPDILVGSGGLKDDEYIIIDTAKLDPAVNGIRIGFGAYKGDDLAQVPKPHIRGTDGAKAEDREIFNFDISTAFAGDTLLHAATLFKGPAGWALEAVGIFYAAGQGVNCVQAFVDLK